jgi:outer membrane protein OmpA-like peptidoglycan-associated protein
MNQRNQDRSQREEKRKSDQIKQSLDARKGKGDKPSAKAGDKESVDKRKKEPVKGEGTPTDEGETFLDRINADPLDTTLKTIAALEKKARLAESQEGGKKDDAKDQRNSTPQERRDPATIEMEERRRVAKPEHGVGFAFGQDKLAKGELNRWYASLNKEQKAALKDPRTTFKIVGHASRPGSEQSNNRLSEKRAEHVMKAMVREFGFEQSSFQVIPLGEEYAKYAIKSPTQDSAQHRIVEIMIFKNTREHLKK